VAERLSFDTNVFWHGSLPSDDPVAPVCRRLLQAVDEGEEEAWCSALVLIELPKVLAGQFPIERLVALTENLRYSSVHWVPLTESIAIRARELSLERGIAPPYDAAMIATAVEVGATTLMTYDRDDLPIGDVVEGVKIELPFLPGGLAQGELDMDP
jgi:predicted nucleic acid-binding protein